MKAACVVLTLLLCCPLAAQPLAAPQVFYNLPFARDGDLDLLLDVHLAEPGVAPPPLLGAVKSLSRHTHGAAGQGDAVDQAAT